MSAKIYARGIPAHPELTDFHPDMDPDLLAMYSSSNYLHPSNIRVVELEAELADRLEIETLIAVATSRMGGG